MAHGVTHIQCRPTFVCETKELYYRLSVVFVFTIVCPVIIGQAYGPSEGQTAEFTYVTITLAAVRARKKRFYQTEIQLFRLCGNIRCGTNFWNFGKSLVNLWCIRTFFNHPLAQRPMPDLPIYESSPTALLVFGGCKNIAGSCNISAEILRDHPCHQKNKL